MRFLFKISFPVEAGNKAAKEGFKMIPKILEEQKPEAAYFIAEDGKRTGILVMNMDDPSQLPGIAEPWFLALNASIEVTPAMISEDLQKAGPVAQAVNPVKPTRVCAYDRINRRCGGLSNDTRRAFVEPSEDRLAAPNRWCPRRHLQS